MSAKKRNYFKHTLLIYINSSTLYACLKALNLPAEIHSSQKCSSAPLYSMYGVNEGAQKQDLQKPTQ